MKTKVRFYYDSVFDEVVAFFPDIVTCKHNNYYQSYAHLGQHSDCCLEYIEGLIPATKDQYEPLQRELESIGYKLNIIAHDNN